MNFGSDDGSDGGDSSDASSIFDTSLLNPQNPALTETLAVEASRREESLRLDTQQQPLPCDEKKGEKSSATPSYANGSVRLVLGDSVRRWQARHQLLRAECCGSPPSADEAEEHILVRQVKSNSPLSNIPPLNKGSAITSISNNKVHLKAENGTELTAKIKKGGVPPMIDCVGIWDETKQVYVLEIPNYIAADLVVSHQAAATGTDASSPSTTANNDLSHLLSNNPLEQTRQAELRIRKRRQSSALSSQKRPKKKKSSTKQQKATEIDTADGEKA